MIDLKTFFGKVRGELSPAYVRATIGKTGQRNVMAKALQKRRARNKVARKSRRINRKRKQGIC